MVLDLILTGSNATVKEALTTAFASVQTNATDYIVTSLPYAMGIVAVVMGISIAVKVFKRFANA